MRTAVSLVLQCIVPTALAWGPELLLLHNDAFRVLVDDTHPALGRPVREVLGKRWQTDQALLSAVMERGEVRVVEDTRFPFTRSGGAPDGCYTLSYGPVRLETGVVGGVLVTLNQRPEQPRAGSALRSSEEALAEAQRVANIGSWEWDLKTGEVRWSRQLYAIYGVDAERYQPS